MKSRIITKNIKSIQQCIFRKDRFYDVWSSQRPPVSVRVHKSLICDLKNFVYFFQIRWKPTPGLKIFTAISAFKEKMGCWILKNTISRVILSKNTENMGLKKCFLFKTTLDVWKKIGSVKIVHWTQNTVRFVVEIWAREIFTKILLRAIQGHLDDQAKFKSNETSAAVNKGSWDMFRSPFRKGFRK